MGSRSTGANVPRDIARTLVRMPGVLVQADLVIPRAHPHAAWTLPWVEGLLQGRSIQELVERPPWPAPADPLVARRLLHTLLDLRWARPSWHAGDVVIDGDLKEAFQHEGRKGLARRLFDAEVVQGEWWADALTGTIVARHTVAMFDWDRVPRREFVLRAVDDPQALIDAIEPDLPDLVRKLGRVAALADANDRVLLGTPLRVVDTKEILFPMFGDEERILPHELAELAPVLEVHAPELFGERRRTATRIVRLPRSPVEPLLGDCERLPADPIRVGPARVVSERVQGISHSVDRQAETLGLWLEATVDARPVAGPSQRHFDAVTEVCRALPAGGVVLVTSAFLNADNACLDDGLGAALVNAPADAAFVIVYGHANDEGPSHQRAEIDAWRRALEGRFVALVGRLVVVASRRRSHEKALVSSVGDWMVGSWNAASSRPHGSLYEASVIGKDVGVAKKLLDHVASNVDDPAGQCLIERMLYHLTVASHARFDAVGAIDLLKRATAAMKAAAPTQDGSRAGAWTPAVEALRCALLPFGTRARVELVDEQQTRDVLVTLLNSARRDVLLTSDRLGESGLDGALLRDLRGNRGRRPLVRVVWGREWAGKRPSDDVAKGQLKRARATVREARDLLGRWFCASDEPMENHAKMLVVDGLRGLVTSENVLSYGGEKGRHETRELGLMFHGPVLARHLLGRALLQWPGALDGTDAGRTHAPLAWAVAANEVWHGFDAISGDLDFDWSHADIRCEAVRTEFPDFTERFPAGWPVVREEGLRLGLFRGSEARPYDAQPDPGERGQLASAEAAVRALAPPTPKSQPVRRGDLVDRVLRDMVRIPRGTFWMGDDRVRSERPRHRVHITRSFRLGRTPVTQALWIEVMGGLPHLQDRYRHADCPIVEISYDEMQAFIECLNATRTGAHFELPTEAQWEYACRAGSETSYSFGDDPGRGDGAGGLEQYAWTKRNSGGRLPRVAQLRPNAFGLYDMHGLVYETVRDGFRRYTAGEAWDPVGPAPARPAPTRAVAARGGSFGRFPLARSGDPEQEHFRCAARQFYERSHRVSFRLACRIEEES